MITYHIDAHDGLAPGKACAVFVNGRPGLIGILGQVQDSGCTVALGGTAKWFTREGDVYVHRQIEPSDKELE